MEWTRIPAPFEDRQSRMNAVQALAEAGLAVRIVKRRKGTYKTAPFEYFVEYAMTEDPEV